MRRNVSVNTLYMYLNLKYCFLLCQSVWTLRISMEKLKLKGNNANEAMEILTKSD